MAIEILSIEDDPAVSIAVRHMLAAQGYVVQSAATGEEGLEICKQKMPSLVLLDVGLPGIDGFETLKQIKVLDVGVPVVMMTAYETASLVVRAMELGASDYLTKPATSAELSGFVAKLVGCSDAKEDHESVSGLVGVLGNSGCMQAVVRMVLRIAKTQATVLLTGESGTGKDALARSIHAKSKCADQPFVSINCASIPGNLLESELFGHERGAFTDAHEAKKGLVEVAAGGTLFLDEIGLMPVEIQGKILTLLETRKFRRLGGNRELDAEVRFIAATNADLEAFVAKGTFREDLFYRLNVIPIHLPPLRDREEDVILMTRAFLAEYSTRHGLAPRSLTTGAETMFRAYPWPGNVRELKNVIERAVLLTDGIQLDVKDFSIDRRAAHPTEEPKSGSVAIEVPQTGLIRIVFPKWGLPLDDLERQVIAEALRHTGGNISRAARLLHISRHTLRYRMQKHNLEMAEEATSPIDEQEPKVA
jgi:two-component system, NtrC family, response regulator AtoC